LIPSHVTITASRSDWTTCVGETTAGKYVKYVLRIAAVCYTSIKQLNDETLQSWTFLIKILK
jgi:hypothetical protein